MHNIGHYIQMKPHYINNYNHPMFNVQILYVILCFVSDPEHHSSSYNNDYAKKRKLLTMQKCWEMTFLGTTEKANVFCMPNLLRSMYVPAIVHISMTM